jgi:hypothetical protein
MSDLPKVDVQLLQNCDLVVTRPETDDCIIYRKDGDARLLV